MSEGRMYYFEFDATVWLSVGSKVQLLEYHEKGLFIELCALCLVEGGKIKNDNFLHRKLKQNQAELKQCLKTLLDLELIQEKDGFLNIKFIEKQIEEAAEKRRKKQEAGQKGGLSTQAKNKQNQAPLYNNKENNKENYNKNYKKKDKSFSNSLNPSLEEGQSEASRKPKGKKGEGKKDKKPGFLKRLWLEAGKTEEEYRKRIKELPELNADDIHCLELAEIDIEKKKTFLRQAKALLGASRFNEETHMLKSRVLEGAVDNPDSYLNKLIQMAIGGGEE